jgi:hypothetical protein
MSGVIPSEDAFRRFAESTKHYEQTYRNRGLVAEKRKILGGGGCKNRNEIWQITILGSPTGGTFDMDLNVLGTTETMQFNWDDTSTEVDTELDTHTNIANGDVTVTGGPFPNAIINIEFSGDLANHRMPPPIIDFGSLTGGSGVGVVLARYQPGHPTDGSVAP